MQDIINKLNFAFLLPVIVLVIFSILLIVSMVMKRSELKQSQFYNFIEIAGPISVLFISINMFSDGINIELTRNEQKFELQKSIERLHISIEKEILDLYTMPIISGVNKWIIRPEVYASLYSSDVKLYELTKELNTEQTIESIAGEKYIFTRILQTFEDYLQYQKIRYISHKIWLSAFIKWGQSKYLQKHFEHDKSNYSETTAEFAKLIFEYGRDISIPNSNPSIYTEKGEALYKDMRLTEIQNIVKK